MVDTVSKLNSLNFPNHRSRFEESQEKRAHRSPDYNMSNRFGLNHSPERYSPGRLIEWIPRQCQCFHMGCLLYKLPTPPDLIHQQVVEDNDVVFSIEILR